MSDLERRTHDLAGNKYGENVPSQPTREPIEPHIFAPMWNDNRYCGHCGKTRANHSAPQPTAQAGEAKPLDPGQGMCGYGQHAFNSRADLPVSEGVSCHCGKTVWHNGVPAPPTPSSAGEAPIVDFRGWTWDAENRDWVAPASPQLPTPELGKAINTIARYLPDLITAVEALSSELKLSRADSTAAKPNPKSEEQESAQ